MFDKDGEDTCITLLNIFQNNIPCIKLTVVVKCCIFVYLSFFTNDKFTVAVKCCIIRPINCTVLVETHRMLGVSQFHAVSAL